MSTLADALLTACAEAPTFAVLDGAQFDNLPDALREGEFVARSLYLDRGDNNPDQVITAPHLVLLDERPATVLGRAPAQTVPALLDLLDGKPAAVFWQCPDGEEALYKHLRGINMIMIPKEAIRNLEEANSDAEKDGSETVEPNLAVLFRHADANSLGQTIPALNHAEAARMFGPASAIAFQPSKEWLPNGDWALYTKDAQWPQPCLGMLHLCPATMARLADVRRKASLRRTTDYLIRMAPQKAVTFTKEELFTQANIWTSQASELGVKTEAGAKKWCYLQLVFDGTSLDHAEVREIFAFPDDSVSMDTRVDLLLREAVTEELVAG